MAHNPGGSDKSAIADQSKSGGQDDLSHKREQALGGPRRGEQASQIASGQGQRNEQSRHQDQISQKSREQK